MLKEVRVQFDTLDPYKEIDTLRANNPAIGAVVNFIGLMRDFNEGDTVSRMTLEHYPGMTEKSLQKIVEEASQRWDLMGIRVVHRVGDLYPLDPIVLVAVASAHRGEAFKACEFIIDYLKTRAPFWKRESTADGERWVDTRHCDGEAEARWNS